VSRYQPSAPSTGESPPLALSLAQPTENENDVRGSGGGAGSGGIGRTNTTCGSGGDDGTVVWPKAIEPNDRTPVVTAKARTRTAARLAMVRTSRKTEMGVSKSLTATVPSRASVRD